MTLSPTQIHPVPAISLDGGQKPAAPIRISYHYPCLHRSMCIIMRTRMHYTCMHTYKCMKVLHIFCLLSSLNVFRQPGWFSPLLPKSRCFTLVTSLEPASDNNSSTSSWRWKIGTEKMPEKTRRFFSPEKKLLLSLWSSSSASRRVFTWNWKFEIQDVNLFGRFTGNRWWITCWFGLTNICWI